MAAEVVTAPAEEITEIPPAEDSIAAVVFVIAPVPESAMLPTELIAPVGAMEEPPLRVTVPAEFRVPDPV